MPFLAMDIYSKLNRNKRWGAKGTEVEVVNVYGGVFIVRPVGAKEGFAVLRHELEGLEEEAKPAERPPAPAAPDPSPVSPSVPRKRVPRKIESPNSQTSLF